MINKFLDLHCWSRVKAQPHACNFLAMMACGRFCSYGRQSITFASCIASFCDSRKISLFTLKSTQWLRLVTTRLCNLAITRTHLHICSCYLLSTFTARKAKKNQPLLHLVSHREQNINNFLWLLAKLFGLMLLGLRCQWKLWKCFNLHCFFYYYMYIRRGWCQCVALATPLLLHNGCRCEVENKHKAIQRHIVQHSIQVLQ